MSNRDLHEPLTRNREVRLFPSRYLRRGEREIEQRATAAFLSTIKAVAPFGHHITKIAGAPKGEISCYVEVPYELQLEYGKKPVELRPDGVIRVAGKKTTWVGLVEVKTGRSLLDENQVRDYQKAAIKLGANALITISNQAADVTGCPPIKLDKRKKLPVVHFSWERLLNEALVLCTDGKISDKEQNWIIMEWIRYVEDDRSKILIDPSLGRSWSAIVKASRSHDVKNHRSELQDVVRCWVGFLRKAAFRMSGELGTSVKLVLPRDERKDGNKLISRICKDVLEGRGFVGVFRVPRTVGDIQVQLFPGSGLIKYAVSIKAPSQRGQRRQLEWLQKQLKNNKFITEQEYLLNGLIIEARWGPRSRTVISASAEDFMKHKEVLLQKDHRPIDRGLELKSFRIIWEMQRDTKGPKKSEAVLQDLYSRMSMFYSYVVGQLRPCPPQPPQSKTTRSEKQKASKVQHEETQGGVATADVLARGRR